MSKKLDEAFKQFEGIFLARKGEIKDYLLKYKKEAFKNRNVINIERIDATDRLKTSGFRKNLSMWQNFYKNVIVSSCIKVRGREKRYDYKFYFTEEKLGPELLEKVERTINEVNTLKRRQKFEEALKKIEKIEKIVFPKNDQYINNQLSEIREEITIALDKYKRTLQKLKTLERKFNEERNQKKFDDALTSIEEILKISKSINEKNIQRKYDGLPKTINREKIEYLQQKVENQRKNGNFELALETCYEIIELTEATKLDEIKKNTLKAIENIENKIKEIKEQEKIKTKTVSLGNELEREKKNENYENALNISNEIIELAESIDDKDTTDKYIQIKQELSSILHEIEQKRKKEKQLKELEDQIEKKKESSDLEGIQNLSSNIIKISTEIGRDDIKNKYQAFLKEIKIQIEERNKRREIETALATLKDDLLKRKKEENYEDALEVSNKIIKLAESINENEIVENYSQIRDEIQTKLEEIEKEKYKKQIEDKIVELDRQIGEAQDSRDLESVINLSNEIIKLSTRIERDDIKSKYQKIINETSQKIEEKRIKEEEKRLREEKLSEFHEKINEKGRKEEEEAEKILNQVKKLENMIEIEEDILPTIEEFSADEILGDVSGDTEQMINQLNVLLEGNRVEIKETIKSESRLISSSGETATFDNELEIEEIKGIKKKRHIVESGFKNPFDKIVEEAIVSDLIPYNYEITDMEINKEKPAQSPIKTKLKEGLEVKWQLQNIPPQESIQINYDLRKRISRTIIFLLEDQLKIIKTHSNLKDSTSQIEGSYDVNFPFSNTYERPINGLVIEDIIPLYYIHHIKKPKSIIPRQDRTNQGNLVKWNVGDLKPKTIDYQYKLLELYRFEELKASIYQLDKEGFSALKNNYSKKSANKYNQILQTLERYI